MKKPLKFLIVFCSIFLSCITIYLTTAKYFEYIEIKDISGDRQELNNFEINGNVNYPSSYDNNFDTLNFTIKNGQVKKQVLPVNMDYYEYYDDIETSNYSVYYEYIPVFADEYYEILETLDENAVVTGDEPDVEIETEQIKLIARLVNMKSGRQIRFDTGIEVSYDKPVTIKKTYSNFTQFVHPINYLHTNIIDISDVFTEDEDSIYITLNKDGIYTDILHNTIVKIEKSIFDNTNNTQPINYEIPPYKNLNLVTDGISIIVKIPSSEGEIKYFETAFSKTGDDKIFLMLQRENDASIQIFNVDGKKEGAFDIDYFDYLTGLDIVYSENSDMFALNYTIQAHNPFVEISGVIAYAGDGKFEHFTIPEDPEFAVVSDNKLLILTQTREIFGEMPEILSELLILTWKFEIIDLDTHNIVYSGYLDSYILQDTISTLSTFSIDSEGFSKELTSDNALFYENNTLYSKRNIELMPSDVSFYRAVYMVY